MPALPVRRCRAGREINGVRTLTLFEQVPIAEIVAVLGCNEQAAQARHTSAMKRLRSIVDQGNHDL